MAGQLWQTLERFAIEATATSNSEQWRLLWRDGKTPTLKGTLLSKTSTSIWSEDPDWENVARMYRALEPILNKPREKSDPSEPEIPEDEPTADQVFSTEPGRAVAYGLWPPRMPDQSPRLSFVESRIQVLELFSRTLALIATIAMVRYEVLKAWNEPEAKRDTPQVLLDRICGNDRQLLGVGKAELNTNSPSDTPMRNSEDRLKSDPFVTSIAPVTFEEFQAALRTLGVQPAGTRDETAANKAALDHSTRFVARELFLEASNKASLQTERLSDALANTRRMRTLAETYRRNLLKLREMIYNVKEGTLQLIRTIENKAAITCATMSTRARVVFREVFVDFDEKLLRILNIDAPLRLANLDPVEPVLRRRVIEGESDEASMVSMIRLSLRRRNMQAEQKAAFETLAKVRLLVEETLRLWDTRFLAEVALYEPIRTDRELAVAKVDEPKQSALNKWKEKRTRVAFPSLRDYVNDFIMPPYIRARIEAYRSLADGHLGRIRGLSPELSSESSSPLQPPDENMYKRGLSLYQAFVALRDTLLPVVDTPASRAALVGCVDLLFAAHLDGASESASLRESWRTAWSGKLSDVQTRKLIEPNTRPDTEWFLAPPKRYEPLDKNRLGLSSRAFSLYPPSADEKGAFLHRTYTGPATSWTYWLQGMPPRTEPIDESASVILRADSLATDQEWMQLDDPRADVFMRDEDLHDMGRTRTVLPTLTVEGVEDADDDERRDGRIQLVSVADDEDVLVTDDAWEILNAWVDGSIGVNDTPLWHTLRTEVARTYVARFHPLVKRRGPLEQARRSLSKLEQTMEEIEDIIEPERKMRDVGEEPLRTARLNEENKRRITAWKANAMDLLGV